jgi:hypothetical protein
LALQDQPGYIIKMRAKPGLGDKLFDLATVAWRSRALRTALSSPVIIGLLAEPPMRIPVHPYSALSAI